MFLIRGFLFGCFNSKTASAKVDQKLELAIKYLSEQKYQEAILAYQEVIKINSKNITAYNGISLHSFRQHCYRKLCSNVKDKKLAKIL